MDRAQVTRLRFEEHADAGRIRRQDRRRTIGRWTAGGEESAASMGAPEVDLEPFVRRLFDRNGPTGRAAGAGMLASITGMQPQAPAGGLFHFENTDYRSGWARGENRLKTGHIPGIGPAPVLLSLRAFHVGQDSFGPRLRAERERRGISIETIASVTKVGGDLWDGLERNDFSRWPSGIFARAFVRDYARAIGLDADEVVDEFCRLFPLGDRRASRLIQAQAQLIGHHLAYAESGALPVHGDRRARRRTSWTRRNSCARDSLLDPSPRRSTPSCRSALPERSRGSWTSASGRSPA